MTTTTRRLRSMVTCVATAVAVLAVPTFAPAASINWVGTTGFWDVPTNWSSNPFLPGSSDDVTIDVPGVQTITHRVSDDTIRSLINAEILAVTGGSLTVSGGGPSSNTNTRTLDVNGGTASLSGAWTGSGLITNTASTLALSNFSLDASGANVTTTGASTTLLTGAMLGELVFFNNGAGSIVNVAGTGNQIRNLTNQAGATLNIGGPLLGGATLALGGASFPITITNNGAINLSTSFTSPSTLQFALGPPMILAGTGTLTAVNSAVIPGTAPRITLRTDLQNAAGHTIQGGGVLGLDGNLLDNRGLLLANGSGGFLVEGGLSSELRNSGTVRASGIGNVLTAITSGDIFRNVGGVVEALSGAVVTFANGMIENQGGPGGGGTMRSKDAGSAMTLQSSDASSRNTGTFRAEGGATMTVSGIWDTVGAVENDSATLNLTQLLGGPGFITASGASITNLNAVTLEASTLTNGAGGTVNVTGTNGRFTLTNDAGGTVNVLDGAQLQLLRGTHTNSGTINVASAGTATSVAFGLSSFPNQTTLTGTGALVLSDNLNNFISIPASFVHGPGHTIRGAGEITLSGGSSTNQGTILADAANGLTIKGGGALLNEGVLRASVTGTELKYSGSGPFINRPGGLVEAINGATVSIQPGPPTGSFILNDNLATVRASGVGSTVTLSNLDTQNFGTLEATQGGSVVVHVLKNLLVGAVNALVGGTYNIIGASRIVLPAPIGTSSATILLDGAGSQLLTTAGTNALQDFQANSGSFTIRNQRNFTSQFDFANTGTVAIGPTSTFRVGQLVPDDYTQTQSQALTTVSGVLDASTVILNGGTLAGDGTIIGNVQNNGASVSPGSPGSSPGMLTITGDYSQSSAGSLLSGLGGTLAGLQYDVLNVLGDATLAGLLDVDLIGGFDPTADAFFDILLASTILGSFDTVDLPTSTHGTFSLEYLRDPNALDIVRVVFDAPGGVSPAPVPEVSTIVLLGVAAAVVAVARRARRRAV